MRYELTENQNKIIKEDICEYQKKYLSAKAMMQKYECLYDRIKSKYGK